jgi:hypothetical protein
LAANRALGDSKAVEDSEYLVTNRALEASKDLGGPAQI